jgi:hypothetical protein
MSNISSSAELEEAIRQLELEQQILRQQLREQTNTIVEDLKPVNLISNAMKEVASSPYLIDSVIGTALGVGTGYLSRKLITGTSGSPVRRMIGSAFQLAVTTMSTKKMVPLSMIVRFLFKKIFGKKKPKSQEQ